MTPGEFIAKWRASELKERSAAQEHFIDLCRLLREPTPAEADPTGEHYCFERGARKDTGGDGWADVWKRHCFAWEYKGRRADLDAAFNQLRQYALALENPPLLIVSDMARFRIRTNWTNSVSLTHEFTLEDLADAGVRDKLKWAISDPERLRPGQSRQALTERAAATFAELAQSLRKRGHEPQHVGHFVNRLVFCMFAEDVGLLPDNMFTRMLEHARKRPDEFTELSRDLFGAMASGGRIGFEAVSWLNGGLFDDNETLPLEREEIDVALKAAALDWSEIDPSIFGTLFERGLDPDKRSQLGAHYTDREKIMLIVEPVISRPLLAEWKTTKAEIGATVEHAGAAKSGAARTRRPAPTGGAFVAELPRTAAKVHRARSGLRLGELLVPGPARAEGHRAPRAAGGRDDGSSTRLPARRTREREGHRDQRLRRRACPGVGVDRRDPMDAAGLKARGIHLVSLEEHLDTSSAAGELVFHVFGSIAHFEARLISERTRDGIAAARKRGRQPGRPLLDPETVSAAQKLIEAGLSPARAAKQLGIGRATAYRIAAEMREGVSAPLT